MTSWLQGDDTRHVATQVVSLAGGRSVAAVLSFVWLLVAARFLSPTSFGDLTLMLAIGSVAGAVADLGLRLTFIGQVAERQAIDRAALIDTVRRRAISCVVLGLPLELTYLAVASHRTALVPILFTGSLLGTAVYSTETAALDAIGHARVDAANEVLSRAGVVAVGTLWLLHGGGLVAAVAVYALADACSAVVVSAVTWRHGTRWEPPRPGRQPVRHTAPLALALGTATLYAQVDIWLLAWFRGTAVSGEYGAADRILGAALLLPSAMASIAIGRAGRHRDPRRWSTARTFAVAAGAAVAIPAVLGAIWARPILALLWGPRFAAASTALVLLLVSALPGAVISVVAPLVAMTRRSTLLVGVLGGLVVNLGVNLVAIPTWGMAGAGAANVLSELVLACWLWTGLRRDVDGPRHRRSLGQCPASSRQQQPQTTTRREPASR
jgi:O-antigen/teichoic acid export membrane protein